MKSIQDIYKSTSRTSLYIIGTLLLSLGFSIYADIPDYNKMFGSVVYQFLGSMTLGYVVSQFINFYRKNDWRKIWLRIYVFMVVLVILTAL
ncbi:hypothetical protein GCQ56_19580 [Marinifilum sp. N1E240]|uniref:hypothetical protein n=1 Tax=Marinifilum sp. N1E240 TaxID=2608082 RepID=UPI00128C5DC3|nr:hypothetical protein [Marinifilum sp. N1E240]MPQ49207.1 hypothetical protein [Marinifilum sp. N1E240]